MLFSKCIEDEVQTVGNGMPDPVGGGYYQYIHILPSSCRFAFICRISIHSGGIIILPDDFVRASIKAWAFLLLFIMIYSYFLSTIDRKDLEQDMSVSI